MGASVPKIPEYILIIILWIVLATGTFSLQQYWKSLNLHELESSENDHYGGQDWIKWSDSDVGIIAEKVHPLMRDNEEISGQIHEGDILKKIDYQPMLKAEAVNALIYAAPPGKVFIYQVERKSQGAFSATTLNLFIRTGFTPRFTFPENGLFWTILIWTMASGSMLSLISLLIVFPILRSKLKENMPVLVLIQIAFFLFTTQLIRHIYFIIEEDLTQLGFEKFSVFIILFFILVYSIIYFATRLKGKKIWAIVPSIAAGIYLLGIAWKSLHSQNFWLYADPLESAILGFFVVHLCLSLFLSFLSTWKERSQQDRIFHVVAAGLSAYLLVGFVGHSLGIADAPGELQHYLVQLAFFIPLINLTARELKFGKVSVVLTQTILYLLFSLVTVFLYFFIHEVLVYFGFDIKYQNVFEISLLIVLFLIIRGTYGQYEDRLRKYFILSSQKKEETLNRFISLIPRFTTKQKLLDELENALKFYIETEHVWVWMKGELKNEMPENIMGLDLEELKDSLDKSDGFWSKNKQLSPLNLASDLEDKLLNNNVFQVHLLDIKEDLYGFLILGKKKRGVYNLSDLELLSRTLQQTRLTLEVLDLIEREKLLLEKNYEANLTALRSQINPHFLFNTLNTISALIHDGPDEAEDAIEKLAFIFRFTLEHSAANLIKLRDELSLVRTYLDIEQLRFGERLDVQYDLDEKMLDVEIPALVLQTIVENSVKHGIAKIIEKGIIKISAHKKDTSLVIEIVDNGPGIDLSKVNKSTGLNNILTRLEEIYQMKNLLYFENTGNGTKVQVNIPLNYHA